MALERLKINWPQNNIKVVWLIEKDKLPFYCRLGNFRVIIISRIFHFRMLNAIANIRLTRIALVQFLPLTDQSSDESIHCIVA